MGSIVSVISPMKKYCRKKEIETYQIEIEIYFYDSDDNETKIDQSTISTSINYNRSEYIIKEVIIRYDKNIPSKEYIEQLFFDIIMQTKKSRGINSNIYIEINGCLERFNRPDQLMHFIKRLDMNNKSTKFFNNVMFVDLH
jgi:hypothetical protein